MRIAPMPPASSGAPITSDARVMFFRFHLFGLAVVLTLSVARDMVTKSAGIIRITIARSGKMMSLNQTKVAISRKKTETDLVTLFMT